MPDRIDRAAICLLRHRRPTDHDPEDGPGWTLVTWHDARRRWSSTLDAHGVAPDDDPERAMAVAARTMACRGISVGAWSACETDEGRTYRAELSYLGAGATSTDEAGTA